MKKLIVMGMIALGASCFAASEYQVYDFQMRVKTTQAAGVDTTSCGSAYAYRDNGYRVIRGVIAGCGCGAIKADGVCANAIVALWDETSRTQITNVQISTWIVQRIGKTGSKVEHIAQITCSEFDVYLAGFGSYAIDKLDENLDYVRTIDGNFAGKAIAPYKVTLGSCSACARTPDTVAQTTALPVCKSGVCDVSLDSTVTPYFGIYAIRYNPIKSIMTTKNGISNAYLGAPAYVTIDLN